MVGDCSTWTPLVDIAPATWSFWRIREQGGVQYAAAYEDGDKSVVLFSSMDGLKWTRGADVYVPIVDAALCTACGECERVCPTEPAAIYLAAPAL